VKPNNLRILKAFDSENMAQFKLISQAVRLYPYIG